MPLRPRVAVVSVLMLQDAKGAALGPVGASVGDGKEVAQVSVVLKL